MRGEGAGAVRSGRGSANIRRVDANLADGGFEGWEGHGREGHMPGITCL